MLASNVISIKDVRCYVGKAQQIASLLHVWRPFLSNIWNAISKSNDAKRPGAPAGCIWSKQIGGDLEWILEFLNGTKGTIIRDFHLDVYKNRGRQVRIVSDASPWGIGAWLMIDGQVVEYFYDKISAWDSAILGLEVGSCRGQQAFESLAILVSLRTWKRIWRQSRCSVAVKADNLAALTMTATMRAKRGPMSLIAREMALDTADGLYSPSLVQHIPGVTNIAADTLSRMFQPGKTHVLPVFLKNAKLISVAERSRQWWRCDPAHRNAG